MPSPRLSIGIVLYRKTQYLTECLRSLLAQTFPDFELLLLDHDSELQATTYLRDNLPELLHDPRVRLLAGTGNHSQGHNRLMREMHGETYICASADMVYAPNFLAQIQVGLDAHSDFGFAGAKILRWDFANRIFTHEIDSAGLGVTRAQKFFDLGQGEFDGAHYTTAETFGASGALLILRRRVLAQLGEEIFDELLHYKNDADLCYRLRWAGERCLRLADALCWHDRQLGEKERQNKTLSQRADSYFGQKAVLHKNFSNEFSWQTRLLKFLREISLWFYIRIFERDLLSAEKKFQENQAQFEKKRAKMKHELSPQELEKYFV